MEGNYYSSSGGDRDGYDSHRQGRGRQGSGLDRGQEDMAASRGGGRGMGFRGTPENSKTKMCMRWKNGDCRFGDRCNFAHGEAELRRSQAAPTRAYYEDDPLTSSHDTLRNGYHSREGEANYAEEGGNYGDQRESVRREYNAPSRGGRPPSYATGRGVTSRDEVPLRATYEDHRRDFPPSRDEEQRGYEYVPPQQRGGAPYRMKEEVQVKHPAADYNDKPEGMSDEVWVGSGFAVPGPAGWWRYMTDKGDHYYHNYRTKETQWEKPDGWIIVPVPSNVTS
eukprot:TRINITY_DN8525_c0_g1_i2.p2 TRINITY_DN8525_c0_g1~~TRINITY_DN8525_c0_g1_i2.p2  ORF type:complete len:280 (+),score=69.95 TRINITY_DN8525_c0_g1_i2:255-1094(+)